MRAVEDQGSGMSMSRVVEIETINVNKLIIEVKYSIITYFTIILTFNSQNIGKECHKFFFLRMRPSKRLNLLISG